MFRAICCARSGFTYFSNSFSKTRKRGKHRSVRISYFSEGGEKGERTVNGPPTPSSPSLSSSCCLRALFAKRMASARAAAIRGPKEKTIEFDSFNFAFLNSHFGVEKTFSPLGQEKILRGEKLEGKINSREFKLGVKISPITSLSPFYGSYESE